jgi:hypothetical protein
MSHGFLQSRLQATFRKFYGCYNDLVCQYNLCLGQMLWYVSYQSLSHFWYTDLDYGSNRLPELELGFTAGVTGRQGILTPPRHLIPSLVYPEVRVCSVLGFVFPAGFLILITVRYSCYLFKKLSFSIFFLPTHRESHHMFICPVVLLQTRKW